MREQQKNELFKLILSSVIISIVSTLLVFSLKLLTDVLEMRLFGIAEFNPILFFVFPFIGLSMIYILRMWVFRKKKNKGIKEIFDSLETRHNKLPAYKIPSHFVNGILTVAFGGGTGIEVSSVVASASIGSVIQIKANIHNAFRKELICAGVAASVTALFNSPIAGILFAIEVILGKVSWKAFISIVIAVLTAWMLCLLLNVERVFYVKVDHWKFNMFPYILLLGIFSGLNSVYLTKSVLFFKSKFSQINWGPVKILIGSFIIGISLLILPQLYGDGYHAMRVLFSEHNTMKFSYEFILTAFGILLLKPVVTSVTLASGGDGGVFAPSLFIGAFLGLFFSLVLNKFSIGVIPINFMVIGMASVLSASLHAPLTSVFLICGLVGNYELIIPISVAALIAKSTAKVILPYTVYSYKSQAQL